MGCNEKLNDTENASFGSFADSLFQTSVDSSYIAGASVLVIQNGETILNKSYGYASVELAVPMPKNPIFEIGSVTKQFTAAAILKLVEQDKLSLNDDFTKYLEFDTKGRTITINHLLNHTSGIDSYTEISAFSDLLLHDYDRDSLVKLVEQSAFLFEPGEAMIYNNSAYFFLGLIIEKVSGISFEDFLKKEFFIPLKMNDTYYCSTSEVVANKVYGYNYSNIGLTQKGYIDHTWPYAAGSLCSTTSDLIIWMKALHNGQLLKGEHYKSMVTPDTLNNGDQLRYAMGLYNFSNYGNLEIGHGGGIFGFLSQTSYFPESDLYIVCLVNTTGPKGASSFVDQLTWKILEKEQVESLENDIDFTGFIGNYSGQARGRKMTVKVIEVPDGIAILNNGQDKPKTLNSYIGNSTWMDGTSIFSFSNDNLIIDQIYGHYVLDKQ